MAEPYKDKYSTNLFGITQNGTSKAVLVDDDGKLMLAGSLSGLSIDLGTAGSSPPEISGTGLLGYARSTYDLSAALLNQAYALQDAVKSDEEIHPVTVFYKVGIGNDLLIRFSSSQGGDVVNADANAMLSSKNLLLHDASIMFAGRRCSGVLSLKAGMSVIARLVLQCYSNVSLTGLFRNIWMSSLTSIEFTGLKEGDLIFQANGDLR